MPDIVARVFQFWFQELMRDFKEQNFFGTVVAGPFTLLQHCHYNYINWETIFCTMLLQVLVP